MTEATARKEILDLLAQGKINAAEAADMLSAVRSQPAPQPEVVVEKEQAPEIEVEEAAPPKSEAEGTPIAEKAPPANGEKPTWLRIRVRNLETGQNKVMVNLPLRMVDFGMRMARRFSSEAAELPDWESLLAAPEKGVLVEVHDEEDNEHVQIYLD